MTGRPSPEKYKAEDAEAEEEAATEEEEEVH